MRLFLVRHGETDVNAQGLALGRADVPLNERGRWQVARLALALRAEAITTVYTSPLQRCLDTARAIASARGREPIVEEGLIEMDIGEAEGLTFAEVRERYPKVLDVWASPDGPSQPMPGGERLVDVQARAWAAVERIYERHQGDTIAAVTHNFVILSILTRALGAELSDFRRLRHAVAAISVIDFTESGPRVVRLNDTCHLEAGE
ncbi:MAG: histidine phosphatase family protein [Chloroflexi bacterium]|nr:histidine phosphatase family protein [Chloroflexota bacterium]